MGDVAGRDGRTGIVQACAGHSSLTCACEGIGVDVDVVTHLSANQRRFLAVRLLHASDGEAATAVGVHRNTVTVWKRESVFSHEYGRLMTVGAQEFANEEMKKLVGKVMLTLEELLTATRTIKEKDGTLAVAPDWMARAKGVEMMLRAAGLWNPPPRTDTGNEKLLQYLEEIKAIHVEAVRRNAVAAAQAGVSLLSKGALDA